VTNGSIARLSCLVSLTRKTDKIFALSNVPKLSRNYSALALCDGVTCFAREANLQRSVIVRILTEKDTKGVFLLEALPYASGMGGLGFSSPRVLDGEGAISQYNFLCRDGRRSSRSLNTFET
jgi:hypothetical protein